MPREAAKEMAKRQKKKERGGDVTDENALPLDNYMLLHITFLNVITAHGH